MELRKILMVDDDDSIRRVAQLTLGAIGKFEVILARSGREALEIVVKESPDLILLDVMMPGMDGPTVFAQLKDNPNTARIPVVFMTAKIQKHEVESYTLLGATAVISKPFEPMELPKQLRQIYSDAMVRMPSPTAVAC